MFYIKRGTHAMQRHNEMLGMLRGRKMQGRY